MSLTEHSPAAGLAGKTVAPVSAVVPTRNRAVVLERTLASLAQQSVLPAELIVVDASSDEESRAVVEAFDAAAAGCKTIWQVARVAGAAAASPSSRTTRIGRRGNSPSGSRGCRAATARRST